MLHLFDSTCPSQDRHCAPSTRANWRAPGHDRLQPDGDGAEATAVLEETCCTLALSALHCSALTAAQRKCWWDGIEVNLAEPGEPEKLVKLWARRVWTLELSLVCPFLSQAARVF